MRILIDENLPISFFTDLLAGFDTKTIKELGWGGIKNGELLSRIEGKFDLFVTADKNIQFQQNLEERSFAIVEIYTNRLPLLRKIEDSHPRIVAWPNAGIPEYWSRIESRTD